MSRAGPWPSALAVAVAVAMTLGLLACGGGGAGKTGPDAESPMGGASGERLPATLFFPGAGRTLVKEERSLAAGAPEERAEAIVHALLEGPAGPEGQRALPEDATLAGVYLGAGGVLYLDLHRPESQPPPPMGSLQETLMIYSLVNSVALDIQEVKRVSLLWNGVQLSSLAGHLDNRGPLAPRPQLAR